VAPEDREGRPDEDALQALKGYLSLRTNRNRRVELSTNGGQLLVEVEQGK
jgi:hypothetical protein